MLIYNLRLSLSKANRNLVTQDIINQSPISQPPFHTHDTIIIGGGISGLTAAYNLYKKGFNVLVCEKQDKVGGNIKSLRENDFILETGPHSFMGSSESIWKLIEELDFEDQAVSANTISHNRYIYKNKELLPLPLGPLSFLKTRLLSLKAKLRLMLEPFIPNGAKESDTAWEYFCRRFGKEAATYIMSPFISGIYAGDVKKLGAKAAFPKFWQFEKDHGSMIVGAFKFMRAKKKRLKKEGLVMRKGLYSFKQGLGQLTETLGERLKDHIITNAKIDTLTKDNSHYIIRVNNETHSAKSIIIATQPQETSKILEDQIPQAKDLLVKIPMAPVALIHWTVPKTYDIPPGFGFLMPRIYAERVLGTLFPSYLFSNRAPDKNCLLASFYGGTQDPQAANLEDADLVSLLKKDHASIFNKDLPELKALKILRYEHAIPQLTPEHPDLIKELINLTNQEPGLFLAGNYLTGVGMEHAVASGYQAAENTSVFLGYCENK